MEFTTRSCVIHQKLKKKEKTCPILTMRMIILVQKYLELYYHTLKTNQDVTRKADTWKAISTKLTNLKNVMLWREFNFFLIEN